jgi:hypothetical protein
MRLILQTDTAFLVAELVAGAAFLAWCAAVIAICTVLA